MQGRFRLLPGEKGKKITKTFFLRILFNISEIIKIQRNRKTK